MKSYYVKRLSGFVAGWFTEEDLQSGKIDRFMDECMREVPGDPVTLFKTDDSDWDVLLS